MESDQSSVVLLRRFREGDPRAADALYHRYAARLTALARSRLIASLTSRVDADDVAQSAYHSFFQRAAQGDFAIERAGELWNLLATIAMRKLYRQVKRHRAAKRDWRRTVSEVEQPAGHEEPSVLDQMILAEQLQLLLDGLPSEQRRAIELRLANGTLAEIALALGCSERTIRRWLEQCEERLRRLIVGQPETPAGKAIELPDLVTTANTSQKSPTATPHCGSLLYSEYRLRRMIGAGGMGKVFLATETATNQMVAVKALRKALLVHPECVRWFINEAELVARWQHPHIVPVYGWGRTPGNGLFLVMRLVTGPDLHAALKSRRFSRQQIIERLAEVASAVAFAHQQGVIHCDLKPANVLCDPERGAQLADFGLATLFNQTRPAGSTANTIAGTAAFMAPEQIDDRFGPIGPATDAYGLGALIYCAVTGKPPFQAETTAGLLANVLGQSRPTWPDDDLPVELTDIGKQCLSRISQERPSIDHMAVRLAAIARSMV